MVSCGALCNNAGFIDGDIDATANATEAATVNFSSGHVLGERAVRRAILGGVISLGSRGERVLNPTIYDIDCDEAVIEQKYISR